MSCECCTETRDLGCFDSCQEVDTGLKPQAGAYTIEISFNGRTIKVGTTIGAEESVKIDADHLNENYTHDFRLIDSEGEVWKDNETDCFRITVKPVIKK